MLPSPLNFRVIVEPIATGTCEFPLLYETSCQPVLANVLPATRPVSAPGIGTNDANAPPVHVTKVIIMRAAITGDIRHDILSICIIISTFLEKQSIKGSFAPS
jgi:hypothetical protein